MDDQVLRNIQIGLIIALVAGSTGYVMVGSFYYDSMNDFQKEMMNDFKLIIVAGVLAAFALLGLGRRASVDKPPT